MIEMILVIGIAILLMTLVVPMLGKVNKAAQRTRQSADLQAITQALEAYRADQHDYPRLPPGMKTNDPNYISGAELLCWALLAPGPAVADQNHLVGDGSDGMGFRQRGTKGQVYGPYLTPSKFRVSSMNSFKSTPPAPQALDDDSAAVILDYWDNPIYYCPATPNADPTVAPPTGGGYMVTYAGTGPRPMYDPSYFTEPDRFAPPPPRYQDQDPSGKGTQNIMSLTEMQEMLGDLNHNGVYDPVVPPPQPPESQQNLPFLLWSAGPNGQFGFDPPHPHPSKVPYSSDDVTNFTIYFPPPPP